MRIEDLPFAVKAILGRTELPAAAYHGLQIGDILILDQKVGLPFPLIIDEEVCFLGSPGLSETHKAVRIDERVHP